MKKRTRFFLTTFIAVTLLFAVAVPASAATWYLATYPYTPHTSTTVNTPYVGNIDMTTWCYEFSISTGTANIRVTAPSYTIHKTDFSPGGNTPRHLVKTETVKLNANIPVTCTLINVSNPSSATTSANGFHSPG